MIARTDAQGDLHLLDQEQVVDLNLNKMLRALVQALASNRRPRQRRLAAAQRAVAKK